MQNLTAIRSKLPYDKLTIAKGKLEGLLNFNVRLAHVASTLLFNLTKKHQVAI